MNTFEKQNNNPVENFLNKLEGFSNGLIELTIFSQNIEKKKIGKITINPLMSEVFLKNKPYLQALANNLKLKFR